MAVAKASRRSLGGARSGRAAAAATRCSPSARDISSSSAYGLSAAAAAVAACWATSAPAGVRIRAERAAVRGAEAAGAGWGAGGAARLRLNWKGTPLRRASTTSCAVYQLGVKE